MVVIKRKSFFNCHFDQASLRRTTNSRLKEDLPKTNNQENISTDGPLPSRRSQPRPRRVFQEIPLDGTKNAQIDNCSDVKKSKKDLTEVNEKPEKECRKCKFTCLCRKVSPKMTKNQSSTKGLKTVSSLQSNASLNFAAKLGSNLVKAKGGWNVESKLSSRVGSKSGLEAELKTSSSSVPKLVLKFKRVKSSSIGIKLKSVPDSDSKSGPNIGFKSGSNIDSKLGSNVSSKLTSNIRLKSDPKIGSKSVSNIINSGPNIGTKSRSNIGSKLGSSTKLKSGQTISSKTGQTISSKTGQNISSKTGQNISSKLGSTNRLKLGPKITSKSGPNIGSKSSWKPDLPPVGSPPLTCSLCEYSTDTQGLLDSHVLAHVGAKIFKCFKCEFVTETLEKLKFHLKTQHVDLKPFKCPHCDFASYVERSLKCHIYSHSQLLKCELCKFRTRQKDEFQRHLEDHDTGVISAQKQSKTTKRKRVIVVTTKLRFKCLQCDYTAPSNSRLLQHMKVHRKELASSSVSDHKSLNKNKRVRKPSSTKGRAVSKQNTNPNPSNVKQPVKAKRVLTTSKANKSDPKHSQAKSRGAKTRNTAVRCLRCGFETQKRRQLWHHITHTHADAQKCLICPYASFCVRNFTNHVTTHIKD